MSLTRAVSLAWLVFLGCACSPDLPCPDGYEKRSTDCRCPEGTRQVDGRCVAIADGGDAGPDQESDGEATRSTEPDASASDAALTERDASPLDGGEAGMDATAPADASTGADADSEASAASEAATTSDAAQSQDTGIAPEAAAEASVAKTPVGAWSFDEAGGTTSADSSPNHNTATLWDGAGWATGMSGSALNLDGENDRVHLPAHASQRYRGGALTLSVWVYLDTAETDGATVLSKTLNGSGTYNYLLELSASARVVLRLMLGNTASLTMTSTSLLSRAAWHHLAVTLTDQKTASIFIDGVFNVSGNHNIANWEAEQNGNQDIPIALGMPYPYSFANAAATPSALKGRIDEVRIYDAVLDAAEIARLYQRTY